MRASMARRQTNWLLRTFKIEAKEDSKVTTIYVTSKATRQSIAGSRILTETRPNL